MIAQKSRLLGKVSFVDRRNKRFLFFILLKFLTAINVINLDGYWKMDILVVKWMKIEMYSYVFENYRM